MVAIERMDVTPSIQQAQNLAPTETEAEESQESQELQESQESQESHKIIEPQERQDGWVPDFAVQVDVCTEREDATQGKEVDEKPLDLSIGIRQAMEEDIITISDTEEPPIIISDGSDSETGTELGRLRREQVRFF